MPKLTQDERNELRAIASLLNEAATPPSDVFENGEEYTFPAELEQIFTGLGKLVRLRGLILDRTKGDR